MPTVGEVRANLVVNSRPWEKGMGVVVQTTERFSAQVTGSLGNIEGQVRRTASSWRLSSDAAVAAGKAETASVRQSAQAFRQAEAERKEQLENRLASIRRLSQLEEISKDEQIAALRELRKQAGITSAEERRIANEITAVKVAKAREAKEAAVKAAEEEARKKEEFVKEGLAAIRQEVLAKQIGTREELAQLQQLQRAAQANGDLRRKIATEIARVEGKLAKESAKEQIDALKSVADAQEEIASRPGPVVTVGDLSDLTNTARKAFQAPINAAADFQTQLLRIQSIAKASDAEMAVLADSLRGISEELGIGVTSTEAAAVQYEILSAGFSDLKSSGEVMRAALKLAADGTVPAAEGAKTLSAVLNAYNLDASQAARITDILFASQDAGSTTTAELAHSLGQVVGLANTAGISFEELAAAIAQSTNKGNSTSSAITGIRGAIINLIRPTEDAKKQMAELGITVDASTLKQKGLVATLQEIKKATGDNTTAFGRIISDTESLNVVSGLVEDGGAALVETYGKIAAAGGSADRTIAITSQGLQAQGRLLKAAANDLLETAGSGLLPVLTDLTKGATTVVQAFNELPQPIKTGAVALAGLALAGAGGLAAFVATKAVVGQLALAVASLGSGGVALARGAFALLTKEITLSGAAASKTILIWEQDAAKTNLATAAKTRYTAANVAFTQSALAQRLALLGVVGAIAALGLLFQKYIEALEEQYKATDRLNEIETKRLTLFKAQRDVIGKSAQELKAMGKTARDVGEAILGLQELIQKATENGDKAAAERYKQQLQDLKRQRAELGKLEEAENKKKSPPVEQTVSVKADPKTEKEKERLRKEQLAQQLNDIKVRAAAGELDKKAEIDALKVVLNSRIANAAETRRIELDIARLKGQLRDEDARKSKQQLAKEESDRKKQEAADKKALADATKAEKRTRGLDSSEFQAARSEIENQLRELESEVGSRSILPEAEQLLKRKLELTIKEIQAEAKAAREVATSEDEKAAATSTAEAKIRAARAETSRQLDAITDKEKKAVEERAKRDQAEIDNLQKAKLEAQKSELETQIRSAEGDGGKRNLELLKKLYAQRLQLTIQGIEAERDAHLRGQDNEKVRLAAAEAAEAKIQAARSETTAKLADEAKKQRDALQSVSDKQKQIANEAQGASPLVGLNEGLGISLGKFSFDSQPKKTVEVKSVAPIKGDTSTLSQLAVIDKQIAALAKQGASIEAIAKAEELRIRRDELLAKQSEAREVKTLAVQEKSFDRFGVTLAQKAGEKVAEAVATPPQKEAKLVATIPPEAKITQGPPLAEQVADSLKNTPLAITVNVTSSSGQQASQTFTGSASSLAQQANRFNPNFQLGQP